MKIDSWVVGWVLLLGLGSAACGGRSQGAVDGVNRDTDAGPSVVDSRGQRDAAPADRQGGAEAGAPPSPGATVTATQPGRGAPVGTTPEVNDGAAGAGGVGGGGNPTSGDPSGGSAGGAGAGGQASSDSDPPPVMGGAGAGGMASMVPMEGEMDPLPDGRGGAANLPPEHGLDLPPGCEVGYDPGEPGEECYLDVMCDGTLTTSWCFELEPGTWDCACNNDFVSHNLFLVGVDRSNSCQKVIEVCRAEEPLALSEWVCEPAGGNSGDDDCASRHSCERRAELGDGVAATQRSSTEVFCDGLNPEPRLGADAWGCLCYGISGPPSGIYLPALDPSLDTCRAAADVCAAGEALELLAEPECQVEAEGFDRVTCDATTRCLTPAQLDDQSLWQVNTLITGCSLGDGSEWNCSCEVLYTWTGELTLNLDAAPVDVCRAATAGCAELFADTLPIPAGLDAGAP